MRKIIVILFVVLLSACGTAYNSALKQIELGMTQEQVVTLMGDKFTVSDQNSRGETIEYKDKYKNHWFFQFQDDKLVKWYKETEE